MVEAANVAGIKLRPTSSGDTYRTLELQTKAFFQRYQLEPTGNPDTRTFEGKKWYLKKGMACLATPGKSQHNLGIAVDVANAKGHTLDWMLANEHLYGFSHEVQSEPWHIRYTQGNQVPPAVVAHLATKAV
jgi:LAS superfamily LD-carboxypeptidase LdcB